MSIHDLSKAEMARNLKASIDKVGRDEVIKRAPIPGRTLDNYTSGATEPRVRNAIAIAQAVNESVEYMVGRIERENPNPPALDGLLEILSESLMTSTSLSGKVLSSCAHDEYSAGDYIIYDRSITQPKDGGVFLMEYNGIEIIRQLILVPGTGWRVALNKTDQTDNYLNESVKILGIVVTHVKHFP